MTKEFIYRTVKRIYDESEKAQRREDSQAPRAIGESFNEILQRAQSEYPNNKIVQEVEKVQNDQYNRSWAGRHLQIVKMRALALIDSLG